MTKQITFSVVNKEQEVRFSGTDLIQDESYVAMAAFAKAMDVELPYPPHVETALQNFFPPELEVQKEEEDHPANENYLDTGIKMKKIDGVWKETFRLRYVCPDCKNKGNHYILPDTKHVKCYNCRKPLEVRDATSIGFPNKDGYSNFFKAGDNEIDY